MSKANGKYDVIVIGAGHNGLTTAALLAKRGRKVLVVERRSVVGGLAAAEEFHPGHRTPGVLHDASGVRADVIEALNLRGHGLETDAELPPVFTPQTDGPGLLLHRDPAKAAPEIRKHSERDAESYFGYRRFIDRVGGVLNSVFDELPPELTKVTARGTLELGKKSIALRRLGRRDMMEMLRVPPMSVEDWLGEWFESDVLKATLAAPAIYHTFTGPRSPGSAFHLLLWESRPRMFVKGGAAALAAALAAAARAGGVDIRTEANVVAINVAGGTASGVTLEGGESLEARVIAASCHPRHTFLDLIGVRHITETLEHRVRHFRSKGTTGKVNLALGGGLEFAGRGAQRFRHIRIGESLVELEQAFDAVKYGAFSQRPALDIFMPEGDKVLSLLVHFVPYDLKGGWSDRAKDALGKAVIDSLSRYAPTIRDNIAASQVLSPADLESTYGVTEGHVHHGEHAIDQLLVRPTPECARYATPIGGLFLCGSGSHPGGGITCAPGALAAQVIAKAT